MICNKCGKKVREDEDELEWITVNGSHIPIKDGQSKDDAVNDFIDKPENMKTRQDADHWIAKKTKQYGSKDALTSSPEYSKMYPQIKKVWHSDYVKSAPTAMKAVNVKYGDKVSFHNVGSFGNVDIKSGTVINKDGVPYVKLDGSRKYVLWHKGFRQ